MRAEVVELWTSRPFDEKDEDITITDPPLPPALIFCIILPISPFPNIWEAPNQSQCPYIVRLEHKTQQQKGYPVIAASASRLTSKK
jgi:hypothetical protein